MAIPITEARIREIAHAAGELWLKFLGSLGPDFPAPFLFKEYPGTTVNPWVLRLFKFCCVNHLHVNTYKAFPVITRLTGTRAAPSWLWDNGGSNIAILIDQVQVQTLIPIDRRQKVVARLVLHEIGHIVLHLKALTPMSSGHVNSASPEQEEEAWVFCGTILGLALGHVARSSRPHVIDAAWTHAA